MSNNELYDINHGSTVLAKIDGWSGLGTWLNKIVTDLGTILARLNKAGSVALSTCGLAIGSDTTKIKTASICKYLVDGILYTKAATDDIDPTACSAQAASKYAMYLVSINATGTVKVLKGADAANEAAAKLPTPAAGEAPIGAILVATAASGSGVPFTMGTSNLAGTGVTDTYYSLVGVSEGDIQSDASLSVSALSDS